MSDRVLEPSLRLLQRALRFVGELRELPRGSEAQRRHFLSGLAEIVGAKVGISVRLDHMSVGRPVLSPAAVSNGWDDARQERLFVDYLGSQERVPDPTLPALSRIGERVYARSRQQLADDRTWYRSTHVQELRRAAGIDHCILGAVRQGDRADAFSLHRGWGDRPFTARDARLAEIVFSEAAPLMTEPMALPPRQRAVLDALCRGLSEKQIAAELELSPHTVHDHVKQLHLRFGAQSRGELLARVLGH